MAMVPNLAQRIATPETVRALAILAASALEHLLQHLLGELLSALVRLTCHAFRANCDNLGETPSSNVFTWQSVYNRFEEDSYHRQGLQHDINVFLLKKAQCNAR